VIEPSADRVAPPCPHVEACGGCDFMHLSAAAQQHAHAEIVRAAIAHAVPGVALPEVRVHGAPAELAYRTRARLFLKAERRGAVRVGYRAAGSHDLARIDACLVLDPAIAPLLGELGEIFAGASGDGDAQLARGRGGLPVAAITWRGELAPSTWAALDAKVARGAWAGARVLLHGAGQPATFGDPRPVIEGADGAPLVIAPGGFAQPSDAGAALLARRADELARLESKPRPRHVVELFAGSGTLSVLLAKDASFTAVEIDEPACAAARENLAARALAGKVVPKDADAFAIPPNTSIVVLDPPRTGAAGAAKAIAASSARVVVYVACDPPTLARDLAILTAGKKLAITHVETFELFPQTSHVETIVRLERSK
jgi:23S rRNA (uracil1939-C5)-methyltransferase